MAVPEGLQEGSIQLTVTLLLAQVAYPVEVWDSTIRFWQVVGEKWEPDRPQTVKERDALPTGESKTIQMSERR